jgi:hypothetical protein
VVDNIHHTFYITLYFYYEIIVVEVFVVAIYSRNIRFMNGAINLIVNSFKKALKGT